MKFYSQHNGQIFDWKKQETLCTFDKYGMFCTDDPYKIEILKRFKDVHIADNVVDQLELNDSKTSDIITEAIVTETNQYKKLSIDVDQDHKHYDDFNVKELKELAKTRNIKGFSTMNKARLLEVLNNEA